MTIQNYITDEPVSRVTKLVNKLREDESPFFEIGGGLKESPDLLLKQSQEIKSFGTEYGVPEAIGLVMHAYMTAAISTFPIDDDDLGKTRQALLEYIVSSKKLIANSGADQINRANTEGTPSARAEQVKGGYIIHGEKSFVSLAKTADFFLFNATIEDEGEAFFLAPMDAKEVELCETSLSTQFDVETHVVRMNGLFVPEQMTFPNLSISDAENAAIDFHSYQRAWFMVLAGSAYLGGGKRALLEGAKFAQETCLPDGTQLGQMDANLVEFGRLNIMHDAAWATLEGAANALTKFSESPSAETLQAFYRAALVAKYTCCNQAEQIVARVRKLVGTRTYTAGSILEDICTHIVLGPMHPVIDSIAERHMGDHLLQSV